MLQRQQCQNRHCNSHRHLTCQVGTTVCHPNQHRVAMMLQPNAELTALRYDDSGLHCAVGTSNGLVALYDLRSSRPLLVKDHMYGDKITDIKFHSVHGSSSSTGMHTHSSTA